MKKIILTGMLLISGLSFAHNFEDRGHRDEQISENHRKESREEKAEDVKVEKTNERHKEFVGDHMSREHEDHEDSE